MAQELTDMSDGCKLLFPDIAARLPEGMVWQYKVTVRGKRDTHTWVLTGPAGGIHVDAWETDSSWRDEHWMGGIECHSPSRPEYGTEKPSHQHCWVIHKPCWHDGSSLQFSEQIAPYLNSPGTSFDSRDHDLVLGIMLHRYRVWLSEPPID